MYFKTRNCDTCSISPFICLLPLISLPSRLFPFYYEPIHRLVIFEFPLKSPILAYVLSYSKQMRCDIREEMTPPYVSFTPECNSGHWVLYSLFVVSAVLISSPSNRPNKDTESHVINTVSYSGGPRPETV